MNAAAADDDLLDLYRTMARIREFEQAVSRSFRNGAVHGFVHLSIGQEAVAAGVCAALGDGDMITTTHRGHGHCLAKGANPEAMMAELFGRSTGICDGKGGSMHIADPSLGILGANGIVGAGIPLAVGAALASRTKRTPHVAVAFFGDGAVHCGAFHEALTLAVAWQAPVLFVCENNGWAEFTDATIWGGPQPVERATSYGVPAISVEGNDVRAVREAVRPLIERTRGGDGPSFVEARTYRAGGHYEGDPSTYRDEAEVAAWAARDPLELARNAIGKGGAAAIARVDAEAADEIERAVVAAAQAPYPSPEAVLEDVGG